MLRVFERECKNKGKLVSKPQGSTFRDSKSDTIQVNYTTLIVSFEHLLIFNKAERQKF